MKVKKIILIAMLTAIIFVATQISVPVGIGYINFGDVFVLLAAYILGSVGFVSAALGASAADLLLGFGIYAPATALIKSLMVLVFCLVSNRLPFKNKKIGLIISSSIGEIFMVAGYYFYEAILYKSALVPLVSVGYNSLQALAAVVGFVLLSRVADKFKLTI